MELLKRQAPDYVDEAFNDVPQQASQQQQTLQPQQQQQQMPQQQQQTMQPQQQQQYYAPEQTYQQEYYQQDVLNTGQYQSQYDVHQGLHVNVGGPGSSQDLRFEPQIDGTFDPTHYSDQSR